MSMRRTLGRCGMFVVVLMAAGSAWAAGSDVADAAMKRDAARVRALLQQKANVNTPQVDGTTALHWAVRLDDADLADLLIRAGANVSAANRAGVRPLQLAAMNGNAAMLDKLMKAGADPNAPLTQFGDTALMMAARTGKTDALAVLLEAGARVNDKEKWGGTPVADDDSRKAEEFASGWLTPLMLAAREGDLESARLLMAAGADVNATAGDGKNALSLAIFNGNYDLASELVDAKSDVNNVDTQRFTPLFWAVDRRNMETAPNFPWMVTQDPLPLIKKLLDAGANPNALVNNTPRARMREGSPRIVFATALMRAAFAADLELVTLLLERGANPSVVSRDGETMVSAAAGLAFIHGYHRGKSPEERLEVVKRFVTLGNDVNQPDDYGITPLMAAGNYGNVPIIQYLIDVGADLSAHDLGKKNDGQFGSSNEPLMPIDYAIGVGTFVPNNAVIIHEDAVALMARTMKERGIVHTTSECTLRGFTCSQVRVDPKIATPAEIMRARRMAIGHQVEGLTGGLDAK